MAFYRRRSVTNALRRLVDEVDPQLVLAENLGGAALCDGIVPPESIVLDLVDALHETFDSIARRVNGVERLQWALDVDRLRHWFTRNLDRYAAVTTASEHDRLSYLALNPHVRAVLVPNGVHLPAAPRREPNDGCVLFLGDADYPPNRDGLRWLSEQVLPLCRNVSEVHAVGAGSNLNLDGVRQVGWVHDLADSWRSAVISVVPVVAGGGTKLKVLEAMGWGVPIVSTGFGTAGIGAKPGTHYLEADGPTEFASAMDQLWDNPDRRAALSESARRFVADRFTWERSAASLRTLIQELSQATTTGRRRQ